MSQFQVIGKDIARPDAHDKVMGGRHFPVNVRLPGMLHMKILRSPYPHAKITKIDTRAAEKLAGVRGVIVPDEVPDRPFSPVYFVPCQAKSMVQDFVILSNHVRWAGQPVAAVAASSEDIAEAALELIDVEYEELPAVFSVAEALENGAPQIHAHAAGNIAKETGFSMGDLDKGFSEADHIIEGTYQTQRVHTCHFEPRVCVVESDTQGRLKVNSSMQHNFGLREKLAFALDMPESSINVVKPVYIGGGFGGKLELGFIEPLAALLSLKTGKPVRAEQTRGEDFISSARHAIKVHVRSGIRKDGTFTARHIQSTLDAGAHATHASEVLVVHGMLGTYMPWKCPNQAWEGRAVYTNNMIGGGFRGYGAPQGCFAIESHHDEICESLGFDPVEFRLKNTHREGDPHPFFQGHTLNTYRFEECLRKGAAQIQFENRKPAGSSAGSLKRGVGFACQPMWVSGCVGLPDIYEHSGATVKLNRDGTADVITSCIDLGSGQITTLTQIVAEELGLPAAAVRLVYADTDTAPFDAPTHASRATYSAGTAVKAAAQAARQRLFDVAALLMECNPGDLLVKDGNIVVQGDSQSSIPLANVIARAESPYIVMTEQGPQATTLEEKGTILASVSTAPPSNPSPASAEFVEVEVDTDTGVVRVVKVVFAHDIGRVIHRKSAEGQVEGGFQQGMGYALMENLQFDGETGACLTSDFLDYKMPTALEMPPMIESIFIESDEPSGPFGAKSLSEPCVVVPAPAIANAIYNAIGVRIRELPITPEKILSALGKL